MSCNDPDVPAELSHAPPMQEAGLAAGDDPHLRGIKAMHNYRIEGTDDEIGHACGFLVEEGTWAIRYLCGGDESLVVRPPDTHRVPESTRAVRWLDQTVNGVVTRHQIESAPACDTSLLLERRNEETLFMHHGSAGYWVSRSNDPEDSSRRK